MQSIKDSVRTLEIHHGGTKIGPYVHCPKLALEAADVCPLTDCWSCWNKVSIKWEYVLCAYPEKGANFRESKASPPEAAKTADRA